jgi:hypothetical protein
MNVNDDDPVQLFQDGHEVLELPVPGRPYIRDSYEWNNEHGRVERQLENGH